jgi:signal transduction histidine kinase
MSKLVDRLLDVSRLSEGRVSLEMGPVDLVDIVEEVVERQRDETDDASLSLVGVSDGAVVGRWDPDRIDQVVTNLVSNAIKYGEGEPIEVGVADRGECAAFWVEDRGVGIPTEQRERIFERFERGDSDHNHSGGLGLGLWIVREIVHAFGGEIDVESEVGEGTTFYVTLPKE